MMARKALLFGDQEIYKAIMQEVNPNKIKALGRRVRNFVEDVWKKNRYRIVCRGTWLKFSQNKMEREVLLGTGNLELCEASMWDAIWGVGEGVDKAAARIKRSASTGETVVLFRGKNLLGRALGRIRSLLRENPELLS
jgi:ribA/ribD-fused uncharacterized protein